MHILMVAAENDALPGGKVGGLGDVIRDVPAALARAGHQVSVLTPGYGIFAATEMASQVDTVTTSFCGRDEPLALFSVRAPVEVPGVRHWVLEHPLFSAGGKGRIYTSEGEGPFADDAHRFALFCAAAAETIANGCLGRPDVLHCHDWHTGLLLVLRRFAAGHRALQAIPAVFSIHNLSMQGTRPLWETRSSLYGWFPDLQADYTLIADPRYRDCVNPLRAGINLADRVHTVSPTYAREILGPSHWDQGVVGGEGLEADLQRVHAEGRLFGILNGCDYATPPATAAKPKALWPRIEAALDQWVAKQGARDSHYQALKHLHAWQRRRTAARPLLVSIGRLTAQKLFLLVQPRAEGSVMDEFLLRLGESVDGAFILLGSGDPEYDRFFTACQQRHGNFLYLSGYSDELANTLYSSGDLFVMPSIYEPCGISQMLAMRAGVPCLVHGVGGLHDTVRHGIDGFSFTGADLPAKLEALLGTLDQALTLYRDDPGQWRAIATAAAAARFSWDDSVAAYLRHLYTFA
ncbi:MAG: hypothetical protein RLZZ385_1310 [Pseudomonadota bacterium]|jgi:starch synthase